MSGGMGWLEKLRLKKQLMLDKANEMKARGMVRTEQIRAERLREKQEKAEYLEPGTFRYGLLHRQNPLDFMSDVKKRRENKRR
jgi:hypothetical protein